MGTFDALYASLSEDPRVRGTQFEHVVKWFLENDPVYRHELRRVWLWKDWEGSWGIDAGIDLVAEDRNGDLWAIQAKAYDPRYRVSKKDVDKFLSESGRKVIAYRMLIATTDLIDRIGERTLQQQEKHSSFFRLNDLRSAAVDWPKSPAHLKPAKLRKPAKPRPHQAAAIRDVMAGFATSPRGQLIMACGVGKTLTGLFVTEALRAQRTLVLVPSLSLLKQTMSEWRANCGVEFASMPVCSDETVSSTEDAALMHTSDLHVPARTDPAEIASFLRRRAGPLVMFATYQSSPQIAAAFALGRVPGFDLIIADEAHRVAGKVSSDFGIVLDPNAIKGARRLFMTATPRYFTGRVLKAAQEANFEYASMDDPAKFGPVFHRLSFGEAIERDLLTDYQVVIVGVDDVTYRKWAEKGVLVTRDGVEIDSAAELAGQIGLAKAMRKYDLRRLISFHSFVKRARDFSVSLPEVIEWMPARHRPQGDLWSRYASGEMPAGDRYVLLQHLGRLGDGERGLIANSRCLSEGIDVPTLDGVAFIDPKNSEVDIIQAVGRAIRKSDTKTVGTIVIPVFVSSDEDPDSALNDSRFKPVWTIIRALRSHDAELGEQLDTLRREMGRKGGTPKLPDKIHVDVPATVGTDFARAFDARLVEQTTQSWEFWYGLLEKYVTEHNHAWVRGKELYDGLRLGQWVVVQRNKWDSLSEYRRAKLQAIPGWITDVREMQWEEGFSHLQQHAAEHGTAQVHDDWVAEDGYQLGKWVGKQRIKWDKLSDGQRERVQSLPEWTTDALAARWEKGYSLLRQYAAETGHANPPSGHEVDGFKLGIWVRTQRANWETLPDERQRRLREIDSWMVELISEKWERACRLLEQHTADSGTSLVKQTLVVEGFPLGRWVSKQRDRWDLLTKEQRARLEVLPGWTRDARGVWWEEGFGHLQAYVTEHGTALLPNSVIYNGYPLGGWVSNQKTRWETLGAERQRRLSSLPGWTMDARTARWEEGFEHLQEYTNTHGTCRLPNSKYIHNGFKLGIWVNTQRSNWDTLPEDRQKRLRELPDWTENTRNALWEEGFSYLSRYIEVNGTALVTSTCIFDGFRLGQWVTVQRSKFENLDPERRQRLAALPGWATSVRDAWWEEGFRHLEKYVANNGDASPTQNYIDTEDGYKLGIWVNKQRQNETDGALSPERRKRLVTLPGWQWTPRDSRWDEGFTQLLRYMKNNSGAFPAQSYETEDDYRLGAWVNMQRNAYRKNRLDPSLSKRLADLPGWQWNPRDALWEEGFSHLLEYGKNHGHHNPTQAHTDEDGYNLGAWISQQRQAQRKGTLNEERAQRLSKLKGWQWIPPRGGAARRK